MPKKSAIRITNAEANLADAKIDAALDAAPITERTITTVQILRNLRNVMSEQELLKVTADAARLTLRGWDSEDRADCSAELVWQSLAEHEGSPPMKDSRHGTLTYFCGQAKNWRKAQLTYRRNLAAETIAEQTAYAESGQALLDALADQIADDAAAADALAEGAEKAARRVCRSLQDDRLFAIAYQWARDETAAICAAENQVKLSTWQMKHKRGADALRERFPSSRDAARALTGSWPLAATDDRPLTFCLQDSSREAGPSSPGWNMAADYWQRPTPREDAPTLLRHQCPAPGLKAAAENLARRGHWTKAPGLKRSNAVNEQGKRAPAGFIWTAGRSRAQAKADALRTIARDYASQMTSAPSVSAEQVSSLPKFDLAG